MMTKPIPYGKQQLADEDIEAVVSVLKSEYWTQGPEIALFEQAFADYVGAEYAVAVSNGTAALHLSVLAMNIGQGDKVITTPITFAASANCIEYCEGEVVFADIDPASYLIDIDEVKKQLKLAPTGSVKGIIPVQFAGRCVNMEALRQLADEYNLWIIEDACHAPGGYFIDSQGTKQLCGNGKFADCSIFSFHPVKHIATGEGGMITTNDKEVYDRLCQLRTHGITRNEQLFERSIVDVGGKDAYPLWYMEMQELGYNYRLTDLQAALGRSQLTRADQGLARRKEIAAKYSSALEGCDFILGQSGVAEGHAYHLYVIEVSNRLELYQFLRSNQIFAQIHYIPCHLMPYYQQKGWKKGDFIHAEAYYDHCISLPMFPSLTTEEQEYVIATIKAFYA